MSMVVRLGERGGQAVAIKEANDDVSAALLRHELKVVVSLAQQGHTGVVRAVEIDEAAPRLVTALAGQPLTQIAGMPMEQAAQVTASVAMILANLHGAGVVHGAIDPSHVLLGPETTPTLCSFGHSTIGSSEHASDDVAALGHLLRSLVGDVGDGDVFPDRRRFANFRLSERSNWLRRSLLTLADHATADDADIRPPAERFARMLTDLVPPTRPEAAGAGTSPNDREDRLTRRGVRRVFVTALAVAGTALVSMGFFGVPNQAHGPHQTSARLAFPSTSTEALGPPSTGAPSITSAPTTTDVTMSKSNQRCPGHGPDLDKDGCGDRVSVDGNIVTISSHRFEVGRAGDVVVVGDWDCDGTVTPALLRPSSGQIFVFTVWATRGELHVRSIEELPDARSLRREDRGAGCDGLVALDDDGRRTTIETGAAS